MDVSAAAGTTIQIVSIVTNLDDGSSRNISGANGTFQVLDAPDSLNPVVATGVVVVTDSANGEVTWTLPPAATAVMAGQFHVLHYECRLNELDGTKSLAESGKLILS